MGINYENLLTQFISFNSISADPKHNKDSQNCANWLAEILNKAGFITTLWAKSPANPVVYASYVCNTRAKTILIYGHYDVQPAKKSDGWATEPFRLTKSSNRYYGRGVMDNKGQILIHIYTALKLLEEKKLNVNLKFLIEGNEEADTGSLTKIVVEHSEELNCDHIIISDGDIIDNHPVIEAGLRGVCNATLVYKTANTAVHSGSYGNTIPNAAHELSRLITKLFDADEDIIIPGFYADVPKEVLTALPVTIEKLNKKIGIKKLFLKDNDTFHNKTGNLPALVVTGIHSGYVGAGYANIVPNTATLNFNLRFGQQQSPEKIINSVKTFIKKATPNYVDYELTFTGYVKATRFNLNTAFVKRATKALEAIYQQPLITKYVGGTLPIVNVFSEYLHSDPVSVPLANNDANMHGINENLTIESIELGLKFSEWLLTQN